MSTTVQTPEFSFPPSDRAQQVMVVKSPANFSEGDQPSGPVSLVIVGSELVAWGIPHIHTALCLPGPRGTDSVPHTGCVELWMHAQSKKVLLMELRARVLGSNPAPTTCELCNREPVISLCLRFLF